MEHWRKTSAMHFMPIYNTCTIPIVSWDTSNCETIPKGVHCDLVPISELVRYDNDDI